MPVVEQKPIESKPTDSKATPVDTIAPVKKVDDVDPTSKDARLVELNLPAGPIEWGRDLARALEAVYVGSTTVRFVKDLVAKRYNDPIHNRKPANHEDRHLTSLEVVHAMKQQMMDMPNLMSDRTVYLAEQFARDGSYTAPVPVAHPADLIAALPKTKAPVRDLPPLVAPEVENDGVTAVETIGARQMKGAAAKIAANAGL
jgi:hypothetical protein